MKYSKNIKKSLMFVSLIFMLSSCSKQGEEMTENITENTTEITTETNNEVEFVKNDLGFYEITQDVAKEMIDNSEVVILDVREDYEYEEGHIENSVLLPLSEVEMSAESILPNKDETILVYCRSGNRSKQASSILARLGYTNIYEFGGINTWEYGVVK